PFCLLLLSFHWEIFSFRSGLRHRPSVMTMYGKCASGNETAQTPSHVYVIDLFIRLRTDVGWAGHRNDGPKRTKPTCEPIGWTNRWINLAVCSDLAVARKQSCCKLNLSCLALVQLHSFTP